MSSGTSKASMFGGGTPDFMGLANAQSQGQQNLLTQQTWANRPDINTPWGSYNWTSTPAQGSPAMYGGGAGNGAQSSSSPFTGFGPAGGGDAGGSGMPDNWVNPTVGNVNGAEGWTPESWSLDVTLSPEQQALFGQQQQLQGGTNQAALDRLGAGISGQGVEDALYSRLTSRLDPQWNQRADQQRTQLYNMGLREGDAAYSTQMDEFNRNRNDAYQGANWQSILGGDQSAASQVNIINALRQGNQVNMPGQPNVAQAGMAQAPDMIGAANASAAYQAQNNPINVLGQFAPFLAMLSDARLKSDIRYLDVEALPGVRYASWKWKAGGKGFGVIAQDVAKVRPDLVTRGEDGYLRVDYSKIGA